MKPSIGRIVIFHFPEALRSYCNNNSEYAPAIITAVWSDVCVNLKVISDGPNNYWFTSCSLGSNSREWSWPEIVK
jgi:hypothetical protein